MIKVEVLGTGCAKCKRLFRNVEEAVENLGADAEIEKVEDMDEILARGVMMMPALFVDGEAKAVGRIPGVEEIKELLKA